MTLLPRLIFSASTAFSLFCTSTRYSSAYEEFQAVITHISQPTATAVVDGAYFAQYMFDTTSLQTYLSFLTQEQRELFTSKVVQKANETLATGTPLSLETLVFVAQKPASQ
jgi:hypothetical protein